LESQYRSLMYLMIGTVIGTNDWL